MLWGRLVAIALRLALTMADVYVLMVPGLRFVVRSCSCGPARMAYRWSCVAQQVTFLSSCALRSDFHEEASVKTGARRLRDFPDIHSASSATAERHERVCGCSQSHPFSPLATNTPDALPPFHLPRRLPTRWC
jgi:hypothetical protein